MNTHRLKRAVIKEELVALTGDWLSALILQQFLFWLDTYSEIDRFIEEEKQRDANTVIEPTSGWFYKSAEELSSDLMLNVSVSTIQRAVRGLIHKGWLNKRTNPHQKWDRTPQYRPDVLLIQADLEALGYHLSGFKKLNTMLLSDASMRHCDASMRHSDASTRQPDAAIPESTTERKTERTPNTTSPLPFGETAGKKGVRKPSAPRWKPDELDLAICNACRIVARWELLDQATVTTIRKANAFLRTQYPQKSVIELEREIKAWELWERGEQYAYKDNRNPLRPTALIKDWGDFLKFREDVKSKRHPATGLAYKPYKEKVS